MSYGLAYTFSEELLQGVHNLATDSFKIALYTDAKDQSLTSYTATNEVSGGSYSAGGAAVTMTLSRSTNTVTWTMTDFVIETPSAAASFVLYNVTQGNKAILIGPLTGVNSAGSLTIRFTVPVITLVV